MSFPNHDSPFARVTAGAAAYWPLKELNLTQSRAAERKAVLHECLDEFASAPVDLEAGPLVDSLVVKTSPDSWILGLKIDHIVLDDLSLKILVDELSILYNGYRGSRAFKLQPNPIVYSEYSRAHRDFLAGPKGRYLIDHWVHQFELSGYYPPELRLIESAQLNPRGTGKARRMTVDLSRQAVANLWHIGRKYKASPYMTSMAALFMALRKHSQDDDIGIAIVESGRNWHDLENLVGLLLHQLQAWCRIPKSANFEYVLKQVRKSILDAITYSAPLWYVTRLHKPASLARRHSTPRVKFDFDMNTKPAPSFNGALTREYNFYRGPRRLTEPLLHIRISPRSGRWQATCDFAEGSFDSSLARSLLEHISRILDNPDP